MSNPDQSPALSLEEFRHWLNDRRMHDVSEAFHEIVSRYSEATEAAAMAATVPASQLYFALNNLLTHLGLEGSIDADHGFVWDTMTALKRIDGGVYLDNLAVPTEPDAHRDDMLAAVRMLEDGEWAEHFAKTPIGKRLEDAITKLHSDLNDAQAPVAGQPAEPSPAVTHLLWLALEHPISRYLMSNAEGRWNGAEKAHCHEELCRYYVAAYRGTSTDRARRDGLNDTYNAVHRATQALTDHMDEVIGFPLEGRPDYDTLAPKFFAEFHRLAVGALAPKGDSNG